MSFLPNLEFSTEKAKKLFPLAVIYVLMIGFNNICLKYVDIAFYQVARSLTILFSLIFTYFILKESTSVPAIISCFVVIFGYIIGTLGEYGTIKFSWNGVIFGIGSSAFVSLNGIYVKQFLKIVNGDQWLLQLYNSVLAIVVLFPFALFLEFGDVMEVPFLFDPYFLFVMSVTAFLGWLINIAIYFQIKYTSPLTNSISGTAKACVQSLIAIIFFEETGFIVSFE